MTNNDLNNTAILISEKNQNCVTAKLDTSENPEINTNISTKLVKQLRASAEKKEISIRITSKNTIYKVGNINTY